jgi:molecular chaperone GrpE
MSEKENDVKLEETPENDTSSKGVKRKLQKKDEEISKLKADVDHWKNEYYRAYADTQNLRKEIEKDYRNAIKYRAEGFIDTLLPVLDSFHMALENPVDNPDVRNYCIGFQYIYKNLVQALESEGVSEIAPAVNQDFDSATMDAIEAVESDLEPNKVVRVIAKGYKIHDRLVRPARVIVSKQKEEK